MKVKKIILVVLVVVMMICSIGAPHVVAADTFAAESLIIPMDTNYQDPGMLKVYGLVYDLLRQGVPVRWVIKQGKIFQSADFIASAKDHISQAVITDYSYRGGPFVVDFADAALAIPIIDAWQSANPSVVVHEAIASFTGDVARYLVAAPRIAVFADGNQTIAFANLNAAGIPDSTGAAWSATSPDLLTPALVAGPTSTNHSDGALFDADGAPLYCQLVSMHWSVASAQANPEVVAEVRQFLMNPVNFFAQCQSVLAFENATSYGHFLTPNGLLAKTQPASVDYYQADRTLTQIDGPFATVGGSEPAFGLPVGDSYNASNVTMITAQSYSPGDYDLWMSGYIDGACEAGAESCGSYGKVSYLGGHQYTTTLPISTHPTTQGVRLFLDSLFDATCATANGQPQITFSLAQSVLTGLTAQYTINFANTGPSVALNAVITDALPAGASFVSATGGGALASKNVSWNVGNLGVGESGAVSVTVIYDALGDYTSSAQLGYKVGLSQFIKTSNIVTTEIVPLGINGVASPTNSTSQTISGTRPSGDIVVVSCPTASVGLVTYPTATTWSVTLTNMTEGSNTITATSTWGGTVTATIIVEIISPIAILSGLPSSPTKQTSASLTVGGVGVVAYQYSLDSGSYSMETPIATVVTLTGLSAGSHTVSFVGKNAAGNWQSQMSATTATWTIDTTPPVLTISALANGSITNNQTLNVAGSVTDTIGLQSLVISGATVTVNPDNTFSSLVTLNTGSNTITTVATDLAGNTTTDTRVITLDQTAPGLAITAPADNSITNQLVSTITGTVNESAIVSVKLNNGSSQAATIIGNSFTASVNLASGINTIDVTATDLAGNTSSGKRTVTYDNTKPGLAITLPGQDTLVTKPTLTISGTVSDTLTAATVLISTGTATFSPTVASDAFSQSVTFPAEGTYAITATATDEAGNTTTVTRNIIYTKLGDVDDSGTIDLSDAIRAFKHAMGIELMTDPVILKRCDVAPLGSDGKPNPDGKVDIGDVIIIMRKIVGLVSW